MVVYRYPVYDLDVADHQFNIIDLGNTHQLDKHGLAYIDSERFCHAANETITYLTDKLARSNATNCNYKIGE
jgi:hypothetical protein